MKKHIIIAIIAFILGAACGIVGTVLVEKQDVQKEVTIEIATNTDVTETDVIEEVIATETDASSIEIVTTEEVTTTEEEVTEEISTAVFYYEPAIAAIATEAPPVEVDGMTYLGTYSLTAYCACVNCCGKSNGITASGTQATAGRTVACNSLPMGTVISINGNQYVVEDTGGMGGNVIDIFFDSHEEALNFGRQSADVYLVN